MSSKDLKKSSPVPARRRTEGFALVSVAQDILDVEFEVHIDLCLDAQDFAKALSDQPAFELRIIADVLVENKSAKQCVLTHMPGPVARVAFRCL
jgi:hypothetical protein